MMVVHIRGIVVRAVVTACACMAGKLAGGTEVERHRAPRINRAGPARPGSVGVPHRLADPGPRRRQPRAGARGRRPERSRPADGPERRPDPARGPPRQGGLGQLLGVVVPAVPGRDSRAPRPRRGVRRQGARDRGRRGPGDDGRQRPRVRRALPARLSDRVRHGGRHLPPLQGLRAADPVLHRHERGHPAGRERPGRRGRRGGADRIDAAAGARWLGAFSESERQPQLH